jgi:hypothetical protein
MAGAPAPAAIGGAGSPAPAPIASAGTSGSAGLGGVLMHPTAAGGAAPDPSHDDCVTGEAADSRDAQLTDIPDQWKATNGDIDLIVPKLVLDWMGERVWEASHDAWHNIRRCKNGGAAAGVPSTAAATSICSHTELIPVHQECADADDGYAFLVVHRHMIQSLKQTFPTHADLFQGFPHFPFDAKDVPVEWQSRWGTGWSQSIIDTANTLEDIENKLSQFPTDGDLGKYIQCGGMSTGASSIHGALHFKWVVNSSPYSLGKQAVNIDNYMFWKLHGWIDGIWERYRVAKGLTPDDPKLMQTMTDQCREMHALGQVVSPIMTSTAPLPVEHGEFAEMVRPILEKTCSSCHSETSPEAGMSLGGHITSADVVKGLVNVPTMHGGQFMRILPGDPTQSWLYLKASGMAMNAGCSGSMCNAQVMPPTGQVTLTQAELDTIRQWIVAGAPMPTQ